MHALMELNLGVVTTAFQIHKNMKLCPTSGFTLIELLVVVTIMGILSGIGYQSFFIIQQDQLLKKGEKQIRVGLNEAKQNAFLGKKPSPEIIPPDVTASECTNFGGYTFTYSRDQFTITPVCSKSFSSKTTKLDTGFKINIPEGTEESIIFKSVNRGTDLTGDKDIQIKVSSNKSKTITVTSDGEIR